MEARKIDIFRPAGETRKGLDLFLKTLSLMNRDGDLSCVKKVVFLGRVWRLNGLPADKAIADFFADELPGQEFELITNLDHLKAMEYLDNERHRSLIVLPSLSDNYPYTVLECLEHVAALHCVPRGWDSRDGGGCRFCLICGRHEHGKEHPKRVSREAGAASLYCTA